MSEAVNTAAFFDLDKTISAKSSVLAFGRSFYREGLLSRRSIVKSLYAQVVFMLVGADAEKMEKLRVAMSAMTRGWNRDQVASIVRDALTDVFANLAPFAESNRREASLAVNGRLAGSDSRG